MAKFAETFCSQCGAAFGPGDTGYSHCDQHKQEAKMGTPKMRHCFYCGEEIGVYADHDRLDTCGKRECERAAMDEMQAERDEAHERLDRDMGY